MPQKKVMNLSAPVLAWIRALMRAVASGSGMRSGAIVRNAACTFAMSRDAGTPLPDTSAMASTYSCSDNVTTS